LSDNVGPLNLLLAGRLEVALVLANDPRRPVGIVADASSRAARVAGANHLSRDGRLALLDADYAPAWGRQTVRPAAFITGVAALSADLKTIKVRLMTFDRAANALAPFGEELTASVRSSLLSEAGESFMLRGAFDEEPPAAPAPAPAPDRAVG